MPHFVRSGRLGVCLLVLLLCAVSRPRAQSPQPQGAPPAPQTGNGLILGQVVDAASGKPVSGALVSISGGARTGATAADEMTLVSVGLLPAPGRAGGPNATLPVLTDGEGRFLFASLARGVYTISAGAAGYAPGMFGRRRVDGPGRPLDLGLDERNTDAQIRI